MKKLIFLLLVCVSCTTVVYGPPEKVVILSSLEIEKADGAYIGAKVEYKVKRISNSTVEFIYIRSYVHYQVNDTILYSFEK